MKSRSAAPSVSEPLPPPRLRAAFRGPLLRWFRQHQRDLPWRRARTPYRVWISELMLQQTRADQALPYYERFLRRFPTVKALAEAPRAEVLKLWEGLGYYARARRAHETARHLARDCGGRFPSTLEGLRALPGVGPYTAAAVGSLAFGLDAAVVDGNVIRVLARVLGPRRRRRAAGRAEAFPGVGRCAAAPGPGRPVQRGRHGAGRHGVYAPSPVLRHLPVARRLPGPRGGRP
jgi:A/G-specific adenine glycosylase